jgi:hypothetical protein
MSDEMEFDEDDMEFDSPCRMCFTCKRNGEGCEDDPETFCYGWEPIKESEA